MSKEGHNQGRAFYGCPKGATNAGGCGFFKCVLPSGSYHAFTSQPPLTLHHHTHRWADNAPAQGRDAQDVEFMRFTCGGMPVTGTSASAGGGGEVGVGEVRTMYVCMYAWHKSSGAYVYHTHARTGLLHRQARLPLRRRPAGRRGRLLVSEAPTPTTNKASSRHPHMLQCLNPLSAHRFLSALAVVAERPDLIKRVLLTQAGPVAGGMYGARLFIDGRWQVSISRGPQRQSTRR